ncbi:hypothetical protein ACTZSU_25025, partial [Klebsiella pneumoniae]
MANIEKLGSSSPEVLLKNATNLDKLVNGRESESLPDRFGVLRKTWHGMEMIFSRFIDYITGRGEQAVAAIGWQELGNWAVGLVVDNRQQIVYYNGSWYKYLGELEHVIAGDSPENDGGVWSAANPTGKWSNIGDAALRSNLGLSDGLKWIGKCKDLSTLRTIEPTISGQSIILERAVVGGPLLNVILTHNPAASDAVDDGYSRFVTAGGAVWDADISFGHNVFLAGYSDELNNLADCLNMIIQDKVNKVISRGYVAGGVDAEIRIPPNPNAEGVTDFYMNKKSVKIPSFLRVYSAPGAIYDYSDFTTGVGIIGSNEFEGLTN